MEGLKINSSDAMASFKSIMADKLSQLRQQRVTQSNYHLKEQSNTEQVAKLNSKIAQLEHNQFELDNLKFQYKLFENKLEQALGINSKLIDTIANLKSENSSLKKMATQNQLAQQV